MDTDTFELIRKAFLLGNVLGLGDKGRARREVTTQISHIFFYQKRAYKIYQHHNRIFNENFTDLSKRRIRDKFYRQDFFWNHFFSPKVYLGLRGVFVQNGIVCVSTELEGATDFVIEMNILQQKDNLFDRLLRTRALNKAVAKSIGTQIVRKVASFPKNHWEIKNTASHTKDMLNRLNDLEAFMILCGGTFSKLESRMIINRMRKYVRANSHDWEAVKKQEYGVTLDCHTTNLFVVKNTLHMIDIYSPKKEWRAGSQLINLFRIGADIYILAGESAYTAFRQGCLTVNPEISLRHEKFYLAYAALIKAPYLHDIAHGDKRLERAAFAFKRFALNKLREAGI